MSDVVDELREPLLILEILVCRYGNACRVRYAHH
jgi:hypothetical protein